MTKFAENTSVPVERSRSEIERTLERYGASAFGYATRDGLAMIEFTIADRHVKFILELPSRTSRVFTHHSRGARSPAGALEAWEQSCRQRWRALALVVKAKLEATEAGISTIEQEFLAHIVLPSGRTVWEETHAAIAQQYELGMPASLLALPEAHPCTPSSSD